MSASLNFLATATLQLEIKPRENELYIYLSFFFLLFIEPITDVVGGPDLFINKGSTINLTCLVKYAPEPPSAMVWSHNQEVKYEKKNYLISQLEKKLI